MPKSKAVKNAPAWAVRFTQSAEADLAAILSFIANREGVDYAQDLLERFKPGWESLASLPLRGHFPPELAKLHISDFREIHIDAYRVIYQHSEAEQCVYIHAVLDARRHVDEILQERLLR